MRITFSGCVGFFVCALLVVVGSPRVVFSQDDVIAPVYRSPSHASPRRSPGFETPEILKGRVKFWVDVFARYDRRKMVVHHRHFPQIVFRVLDFTQAAEELNPVAYDQLRKRVEKEKVEEIYRALRRLASGQEPTTPTEEYVQKQMASLPGGARKYQFAIDEELVRTQTGIAHKFEAALKRTGRYLPHIERIFSREFGLPVELTRLPFIESSFDYTAYSSVGAAGMWQFMPGTAKKFMRVGSVVDERLDPIIATRSAAQYLKRAYSSLGNWPMAVTSYNHGVAGVYRKMKAQGSTDLVRVIEDPNPRERVFGFASTNFWPELLAAVEVYENYRILFPGIELEPELQFRDYRLQRAQTVQQVARSLGVSVDSLRPTNYAIRPIAWEGKRPLPAGYVLRIPTGVTANVATLALEEARQPPTERSASVVDSGVMYTVRKGDTLKGIAARYRTSVSELMNRNNLRSTSVKVGQKIIVTQGGEAASQPRSAAPSSKRSELAPKQSTSKQPQQPATTRYKVRSGDTLWSIAKTHGISVDALKRANGLGGKPIKAGQSLKIP